MLFMYWVDNFIHASVIFRYSGNFVYPEISPGTDVSGLTRHRCTLFNLSPHWNRFSETIPMSGHTIGFGWEIRKLAFWKLSIFYLICCPMPWTNMWMSFHQVQIPWIRKVFGSYCKKSPKLTRCNQILFCLLAENNVEKMRVLSSWYWRNWNLIMHWICQNERQMLLLLYSVPVCVGV